VASYYTYLQVSYTVDMSVGVFSIECFYKYLCRHTCYRFGRFEDEPQSPEKEKDLGETGQLNAVHNYHDIRSLSSIRFRECFQNFIKKLHS